MSWNRDRMRVKVPDKTPRDPDGNLLCKWCGTRLQGRRRAWCSDACVDEYRIRVDSGFARQKLVETRGGCVCASCGLDMIELERPVRDAWRAWRDLYWHYCRAGRNKRQEMKPKVDEKFQSYISLAEEMEKQGWPYGIAGTTWQDAHYSSRPRSMWQLDHIWPWRYGGSYMGLDNMQVLCHKCHVQKTKQDNQVKYTTVELDPRDSVKILDFVEAE